MVTSYFKLYYHIHKPSGNTQHLPRKLSLSSCLVFSCIEVCDLAFTHKPGTRSLLRKRSYRFYLERFEKKNKTNTKQLQGLTLLLVVAVSVLEYCQTTCIWVSDIFTSSHSTVSICCCIKKKKKRVSLNLEQGYRKAIWTRVYCRENAQIDVEGVVRNRFQIAAESTRLKRVCRLVLCYFR